MERIKTVLTAVIAGIGLCVSSYAGVYSEARTMKYNSSVVRGTAYQNFCLVPKKEKLKLTKLKCRNALINVVDFYRAVPTYKAEISRAEQAVIEVPKPYRMLVGYYFGKSKNVVIKTRPVGRFIKIEICKEVKNVQRGSREGR